MHALRTCMQGGPRLGHMPPGTTRTPRARYSAAPNAPLSFISFLTQQPSSRLIVGWYYCRSPVFVLQGDTDATVQVGFRPGHHTSFNPERKSSNLAALLSASGCRRSLVHVLYCSRSCACTGIITSCSPRNTVTPTPHPARTLHQPRHATQTQRRKSELGVRGAGKSETNRGHLRAEVQAVQRDRSPVDGGRCAI
ncbi:hypothetical protein BV25DRAFT_766919 [Artomyces pyxidatus]|uniref:Uncharacterized protein n=1 Tax=Artomyces pyxidatus TaxID=48021 RepID=A0ACB8SZ93_9AGAM|nr:hypothetical protein BV25DRAFT_766919 [Artomyces pyxidatus]